MLDIYQKRKLRAFVQSKMTIGLLGVVAFVVAHAALERYMIHLDAADRHDAIQAEQQALTERANQLRQQVEYLESDRGVEAELRRQFSMTLPGEEVIVIVDEDAGGLDRDQDLNSSDESAQRLDEGTASAQSGWWSNWGWW
jgi:cell division protein FtsB